MTAVAPQPTVIEQGEEGLRVRGPELALRHPRPSDAPVLYSLASDPHVTRFFSWGPYRHVREAEAWLATLPERRANGIALELAVVDSADRPIGITLLSEFSARDRRAVVGTWLGRAHWGTAANHEAKALLAHLGFGPLALERLGAYVDINNARSQIVPERLGFRREGLLRAFHRHHGEPRDVATYALLRSDWQQARLAETPAWISGAVPDAWLQRQLGGSHPTPA